MAVRNRLQILLAEKGDKEDRRISVRELALNTKVSHQAIYTWLEQDAQRFDARVITAFCKYFNCEIGDLLVYEPDQPAERETA